MRNLTDINSWKRSFGLLPIHLNPNIEDLKFLMLNGGNGDFCLQTSNEEDIAKSYFSKSWSTNTKNFVVLKNDEIKIYNWLDESTEVIPKNQVENNTERFYKYLLTKSYRSESDVVPFVLDVFRKLRNLTQERDKPSEALNLLFKLLISLEDDYTSINYDKWKISNIEVPSQFEYFVELIRQGVKTINPQLDLILRHTSGTLFQEAHREVIYFNPQRDLFGGVSSSLITKKDAYSSIHYTPQYLARSIVENSLKQIDISKDSLKILDPACGSSEFLVEALKQLKNLGYSGNINITGWDTSESAVNTSNFLLQYEKRTQWNKSNFNFEIKLVEDSLTEHWDTDYDIILMNPPFVSWELLKNKEIRDAVINTLGSGFKKGKPNQASAFFYKAVMSLNEGGVLGCVLPSSIFTFDSYSFLRNEIQEILTLKLVAKLGNFVFEDALTDVSFFIGQKPQSNNLPKIIWSKNEKGVVQDVLRDLRKMEGNNQQTIEEKNYSIYTPSTFPIVSDSWKIISIKENKLIKDVERFVIDGKLSRVSDIFSVHLGIRQGIKDVFKIKKHDYLEIFEKQLFRPVIDNDAIKNGQLFDLQYIWYPYDSNGMIFKDEIELAEIDFFNKNIKPLEIPLKARPWIQEWWGHTRPGNWQFEKKTKLVSTEFGRSDSFAFDKNGDFVVERGNAWIPKKEFTIDDYYFYLACFSNNIFDSLLSIYSKPIMSGYYLGKIYTKNIPIPNVHLTTVRESKAYFKLVELGKELENGNSFVTQVIDDVLKDYFYPKM